MSPPGSLLCCGGHRRAGGPPALQGLQQVFERPVAVGDQRVALLLAAGDQRREAADAELLGGEEVAEGLVAGIGAKERFAEFAALQAGFLRDGGDLIGRGHVAVLGVEGLLMRAMKGSASFGISRRAVTTARQAGSVS